MDRYIPPPRRSPLFQTLQRKRNRFLFQAGTFFTIISFVAQCIVFTPRVNADAFYLPPPGEMIYPTPAFIPASMKGIKVFPDNPLRFDFIIDTGNAKFSQEDLKLESTKLIKYFLASLTIPEEDLWVNLSPYEKDRIIPDQFGITEMGRDLLAEDYILKQLTASLMYPEKELGKEFWDRVYKKAQVLYGTTEIPINTFNKVWVVPEKAVVYENEDTAFIVESHLKVMLEVDYVAMSYQKDIAESRASARGLALKESLNKEDFGMDQLKMEDVENLSDISSEIVRDVILPEIEKEVNEGENFTKLRQIYRSMILATWFKRNLRESLLGKIYVGKNKISGVDIEDENVRGKIYAQYLEAFKTGVYNYIKEDYDPATQEIIPRKYFSGGMEFRGDVLPGLLSDGDDRRDVPPSEMVRAVDASTAGRNVTASVVLDPVGDTETARQQYEVARRNVISASVVGGKERIVPFGQLVSALRNHIGKPGSTLYGDIRSRILNGEVPVRNSDKIGNQSSVGTMETFIDEHFSLPEEAIREIITNAYDAMRSEPDPQNRQVQVEINDGYMSVSDTGSGMSLDTILKKLYPPFEGEKSGTVLARIRDILHDEDIDKISRIHEFIQSLTLSELSDTERNSIKDVQSRLDDTDLGVDQRIKAIENLVTFTGRFGIGFESLLYFVKSDADFIEVITSTGEEAHRIKFFWVNGELQTGVDVLDPQSVTKGTKATLQSSRFNKDNARQVVNQYLSFNSNARINVSVDGQPAEFVNREVFNPTNFAHVSSDAQVEAFYSRAENSTGKSIVRINVHGVTILTKEVEGYGLPGEVVFNFPAQIGLPISRNKIQVNELFIEKAKDMLQMIASKPELMSAFYPLIAILESNAKASERNVLSQAAANAAYSAWRYTDSVYLPNEEEYSKVKHENVVLVDPKLMRALSFRGFRNSYWKMGEPLRFTSGEEAKVGSKYVYLVDFVDETKFVSTSDAILVNRKHAPQVDSEKALYNVLLKLSKENGRFGYNYQAAAVQGQEIAETSGGSEIQPTDPRVTQISDSLPDERAKEHFRRVVNASQGNTSLSDYITKPRLFVNIYNRLIRSSLFDIPMHDWTKFYSRLLWNDILENNDALDFIFENERIRKLQEYFSTQNNPELTVTLLNTLINKNFNLNSETIPRRVLNDELDRLWELREFLNRKTLSLITSATLLDTDTYEKFRKRLIADRDELDFLSETEWTVLNKGEHGSSDPSNTVPFQLFLDGNLAAVRRIAKISKRLDRAFEERGYNTSFAISMHNMSDEEVEEFIKKGKRIEVNKLGIRYGNIFLLPYYFQFFYGDGWREKFNAYMELGMSGEEIWSLEKIMESSIPAQQKRRLLEAVIESVSVSESKTSGYLWFPFDIDPELLEQIENPALFIQFISGFSLYDKEFLHRKHLLDQQSESVPFGYQYLLRYKKEILRKIITIFRHVSNLPNDEYNRIREDFKDYFLKGSVTGRIAPYVQYLLNTQDARDIDGQELKATPQRTFTLVDLYDTFLENSTEQEVQEEEAGRNGDFTSVDYRVSRAAQSSEERNEERQKLLRNTFRAAAQQSVDDLVMIREVIQNVIDETHADSDAQKVSINAYRKLLASGEELTVIDIQDTIGMNAERLFNKLLMPFSSSKKDPKKFLGKQGQGFFTLLANSEYVILKTVKDGKVRILKITPEKSNGQVVNFNVEEEQRDALADETNGTHIQATVRAALPGLEAARVSVAGQKYAALVDPKRLTVEINGQQINANSDRKLAVEETRYGDVEFYSIPGESFVALGGLFVKSVDDDLMALVPDALRKVLLENGFAINLPFQNIRRIQGGSDIANKEEVYENIKDAVARGAIKLVIAMFARGDIRSLDLLGYDYYSWAHDSQASEDARGIMDGSADIETMRARYFSSGQSNQLAKLLLALPLDFLNEILGTPMSMAELFDNFIRNRSIFTPEIMGRLPQPIRDAFISIEEKERKQQSQQEAARDLGVPDGLIGGNFSLPSKQWVGMGAYWAFIEASNQIARIALTNMLKENSAETLGVLRDRLEYLQGNPTQAQYYAEANGMSMAQAQQGGQFYAWNLLEQGRFLDLFSQYMREQITLTEFLDKAFEGMLDTLTHELVHILEQSNEETHNEVFYKRQKMLVSALIGEKEMVTATLEKIITNPEYLNNLGEVSLKKFLEYVASHQSGYRVGVEGVVVPGVAVVESIETSEKSEAANIASEEITNSQEAATGQWSYARPWSWPIVRKVLDKILNKPDEVMTGDLIGKLFDKHGYIVSDMEVKVEKIEGDYVVGLTARGGNPLFDKEGNEVEPFKIGQTKISPKRKMAVVQSIRDSLEGEGDRLTIEERKIVEGVISYVEATDIYVLPNPGHGIGGLPIVHGKVGGLHIVDSILDEIAVFHEGVEGFLRTQEARELRKWVEEQGVSPHTIARGAGKTERENDPNYRRGLQDKLFGEERNNQKTKQIQKENPGGIDFNPNMLDLQTQGQGIDFNIPFDPPILQSIPIEGFNPLIIQIVPTNLPVFLNLSKEESGEPLSGLR